MEKTFTHKDTIVKQYNNDNLKRTNFATIKKWTIN